MRHSIALMLGCCIVGVPGRAVAQGPQITTSWMQPWESPTPPRQLPFVPPDTVRHIQPTHWEKGLVIGAAIGVVVGGVFGNTMCHVSEVIESCTPLTVGGALVTGALTGTIGALIGGAFPKRE
jgi:hypothetical protein